MNRGLLEADIEKDIVLGTALVDMYAKCGVLVKAQKLHEELRIRNVISWSALIAGYAEQGQYDEVLSSFEHMQKGCNHWLERPHHGKKIRIFFTIQRVCEA